MKKILLLLSLFIPITIFAYSPAVMNLEQQKQIALNQNNTLKQQNTELKAELEKQRKRKNLFLGTTIASNIGAGVTIGMGIQQGNLSKDNSKKVSDKTQDIVNKLNPTPPIIGAQDITRKDFMDCDVFTIKNKKVKIASATNPLGPGDEHLLVSGPLFESNQTLTGGYIENGVQIKSWEDPSQSRFLGTNFGLKNGIFGQNKDGSFFLYEYKDHALLTTSNVAWAIQSGPIFRLNGSNHTTGTGKNTRAVIGWNTQNEIIFVMSQKQMSFNEINTVMASLNVNNAIHLDSFNVGWEWNVFTAVIRSGNKASTNSLLFY
ncbi:MAG: phosphodiester glycosidase family protein [Alphaproteobacteria bacterium]|nr:phosphodiester glycosidase family protein [Alphaproteobacteria bacterium]